VATSASHKLHPASSGSLAVISRYQRYRSRDELIRARVLDRVGLKSAASVIRIFGIFKFQNSEKFEFLIDPQNIEAAFLEDAYLLAAFFDQGLKFHPNPK
jgi:hypothetical protein